MSLTKVSYSLINGEYLNVLDYGADATGVADSQSAIQDAIDAAATSNKAVYFPSGTYLINTPITWASKVHLIGEGSQQLNFGPATGSVIKAGAAMSAMLLASSDVADTNLTLGSFVEKVSFDGNSLANYAIYGMTNHSTFAKFAITKTLVCGICVGYGWDIVFDNLEIYRNAGDGIDVETLAPSGAGSSNAILINQVKVYLNDGCGMRLGKTTGLKLQNCTIETNKKTGLMFGYGSRSFSIDTCYFEGNAETGYQFTGPAFVRADIIFNGAGPLTYGYGTLGVWDCCGTINNNSTYPTYVNSFIFANRFNNVKVNNNYGVNVTPIMLFDPAVINTNPNTFEINNNENFYDIVYPNNMYGIDFITDTDSKYHIQYNTDDIFTVDTSGNGFLKGGFEFSPNTVVTPTVNGQLAFELTSNTSLTIKVKGSDGIVRSGVITLT